MRLDDHVYIPDGVLELRAYNTQGKLLDYVHGGNIVVNGGREALARLMGNDPGSWSVDAMKFGDAGHEPLTPHNMVPVDVSDTDLYGTTHVTIGLTGSGVGDFQTMDVNWPVEGKKVQFVAPVEADQGNGTDTAEYSEAGLFYNNGSIMFAHKSFSYIIKNSTIRLVATWTFTF